MLSNVKGAGRIPLYALLLARSASCRGSSALPPWPTGLWRPLGAAMLTFAVRVYCNQMSPKADRCAKQLFGFSILYLFLLFAEIAGERLLAISPLNLPWWCLEGG